MSTRYNKLELNFYLTFFPWFMCMYKMSTTTYIKYLLNLFQLNIIRIPQQLQYFKQYQQRVSALIGARATQQLVNQALVLITLGGNDFVNNYYLVPLSARSRQFALPDYVNYLISEYSKILRVLLLSLSISLSLSLALCVCVCVCVCNLLHLLVAYCVACDRPVSTSYALLFSRSFVHQ